MVVLMHGFGASGTDLVGLGPMLQAPPKTRFVFPEAPHALDMPMFDGRAWWMIDIERMQRAIMTGQVRDLRHDTPAGLDEARGMVVEMLDAVETELQPSAVVLGGFSQGAMLTTDVALQTDRTLAGIILFSGSFLASGVWTPRMAKRAGLPVFQSHGTHDPVLPYDVATELHEALKGAGLNAQFVSFVGQHEIPLAAVSGASRFLAGLL